MLYVAGLALLFGLSVSAYAATDWSPLLDWVGKYPSEKVGARTSRLIDQPALATVLKRLLPPREWTAWSHFDVEVPVRQVEGFLVVDRCVPHNCPSDIATVAIDVQRQRVWAGFFSREAGRVSTRWDGTGEDYSVLPEEIRKAFLTRHGDGDPTQ
ncbi:hypothetical protein ABWL39_14505 [Chitinivorax sp. PXF-14]|uniref:hypothetical protein n=1 Tax=Chitinivorax sp. PXF-14 TaxID=3230488 RepID=UPI0034656217